MSDNTTTGSINVIFTYSQNWLTVDEYYNILRKADSHKCYKGPPVLPKPGEIYLIKNDNMEDWKSDQYRWRHKGTKKLPPSDPKLICYYYNTYKGSGFQKRGYILFKSGRKYSNITLVHYVGTLKNIVHDCHKNRKHNTNVKHVMTAKSQLNKQKNQLSEQPHEVYKKLSSEDVHSSHIPVLLPRDRTQVSNTIVKERERKLLSQDDVIGLYMLNEELGNYIAKMELLPDFYCILFHGDSLNLFAEACQQQDCILYYDTTFNLGDFYLSVLTYSHLLFDKEPVIPIIYLIHHRKTKEIHDCFFKLIKESCPSIIGKCIITDREAAIIYGIKNQLPSNPHFYCWNHIQRDVKHWLMKQKNTEINDVSTYVSHTWDLLDSDTEEMYLKKYENMKIHWSTLFKHYFDKNIKDAIISSGKWKLLEYGIYKERSGITINPAESFNAVLKRMLTRHEVKAQVLAISLHQLDLYYRKEVLKGYCNHGNYKLKDIYTALQKNVNEIDFPQNHLPIEKLPYIFENKDYKQYKNTEIPFTNYSIAKLLVMQGCVRLIPDEQVFIITSNNGEKYMTKLYPKESCTCKAKRGCHHIKAAKLSIGNEKHQQKDVKLSTIMKRSRGYRSGRKGVNIPKNLSVVEAAEDSIVHSQKELSQNSLLVPTIIPATGIVKNRFLKCNSNSVNISPNTNNFLPEITSTPTKSDYRSISFSLKTNEHVQDKSLNVVQHKNLKRRRIINVLSSSSDDDYGDEFYNTFSEKFKKNKQFIIWGRSMYPSDLKTVVPVNTHSDCDYYLVDSIIDIYLAIICFEYSKKNSSVTIFPIEGSVINYLSSISSFQFGLEYFLKYKIPEIDIVIFPLCNMSHYSLLILNRKEKQIIYLDSLRQKYVPESEISFIASLYEAYYRFKGANLTFAENEWKIYVPQDVPKQQTSYDCGLYVCMFVEILLTQSDNVFNFHKNRNFPCYRKLIKKKILFHMENTNIPAPVVYSYNKKQIKDIIQEQKIIQNIIFETPQRENVINYLKNLITSYWSENSIICHYNEQCKQENDKLIYCTTCDHWFHMACENTPCDTKLPRYYTCKNCILTK